MKKGKEKNIHYHYNENTNKTTSIQTIYLFMLQHFNNNKTVMLNGTPTVLILTNHNGMSSTKKNTRSYLMY